MLIGIIFASTEGQTTKIAQFVQKRLIDAGAQTALVSADAAKGVDVSGYDGIILAGSVHAGRYQSELIEFIKENADRLSDLPSLFLSVSLAAAGTAKEDWDGLAEIVARMQDETGWTPGRVEHVAGAFRFEHYSFVKYWALRWIEAEKDPSVPPGTDKEYTDWNALASVVEDWTKSMDAGS